MERIGATEARANFAELLRRVSAEGERIVIERRGKRRAVLVPLGEEERDERRAGRASWRHTGALFDETERLARLGHWEWDEVEDRCVYCSEELARLHGVSVEEFLRRTSSLAADLGWVHPEDRRRYLDATIRLREKGKGFQIEYRLRQPDGSYLEVREESEPVFGEQGSVIRSFGFVQDITERKQAERELRRINALFSKTERLAKMGHWQWDEIEDTCIFCSEGLAHLIGITVEEYLERTSISSGDMEFVHPEDRAAYLAAAKKMMRQGKGYEINYRMLHVGSGWIEVREVVEAAFDDAGAVVRSFGFVQDITERKQAERDLRESEALLSQAAEMANLGHWVWDEVEDRAVYCSETLARISGVTVEDYIANYATMAALLAETHPEDRDRYERVIAEAKRDRRAYNIEFRDVKPNGEIRYLRERGEPVFDAGGRHVRTVGTLQDVTEHRLAEEELRRARDELEKRVAERTAALQEKSAQLQSILDHSPAMIFLKDPDRRYLLANREFERLFGIANEALASKRPEDVLSPGLAESSSAQDLEVCRTGRPSTIEETFEIDGRERTVLTSKFPVLDDRDQLIGIGAIATDITERKEAELALEWREAQLGQAQQMARIGVFIWDDVEDRCLYCSEEFAALLGISVEEFMASRGSHESILPLIHPEDRARYDAVVTGAFEQAAPYDVEYRVYDAAGGLWHWRELGEPELDAQGRQVRTFGTVQDITAIKKTEAALRESEERLNQAVRLAGLGHWVWDAVADRCIYCSEENARIHGMSVEDYMTKASAIEGDFAMVHPDDRREIKALFRALRKGREFDKEYRLIAPEGQIRHIREIAKPVLGEDGSVVQEFGSIQDITEQKQTEEQLRQAQKMEAVGQLTGGVAHDFNNLLAVVTGNAELLALQLGEDDPKVQAVLRAAGRGAALTQQLLAFSRRQALQPRVLDLNVLVQGMDEMLSRSLGEAIEITTSLDAGLWRALADPGQVENALLNLAINARDAMPGGGTLVIETGNASLDDAYAESRPEVAPGDYVVLAVTDSGSGMVPGVLEHAFEPFFTTKEVGRGTGLGLSMVYGFAKQSDGHVAIYSEEGHGTTVKLYLPRTEAPADAPGPAEQGAPQGRGETVLLVEDNADVRQLAERLLEDLGYRVFTAEDARTALAVLDHAPQPDLLLSDVVLPGGLSGPDLAKQALELYPGLKVLFMSGYAEQAARINGLAGKGAELLNKPFRKRDLALKLRAVLDRKQ